MLIKTIKILSRSSSPKPLGGDENEKRKKEERVWVLPLQLSCNADLSASRDISLEMPSHSRACILSWEIYEKSISRCS